MLENEATYENWYNPIHCKKEKIHTGSDYVLLCKIDTNIFKLASYQENVIYLDSEKLGIAIRENKIANCAIINGEVMVSDMYKVTRDIQFEQEVAEKYIKYVAKTALLGCKMSFDYTIEGRQVKLDSYTGTSKNVIVPKFVTVITRRAFIKCGIETITLNEGLEYIGYYAFEGCNIAEITIPETVKFMGEGIFYLNKKLINSDGTYRKDRIKILNENTEVLDNHPVK